MASVQRTQVAVQRALNIRRRDAPNAPVGITGWNPISAGGVSDSIQSTSSSITLEDVLHSEKLVGVVMCDGFLLWRLPTAPLCPLAYCAAPSGLFGEGNASKGGH